MPIAVVDCWRNSVAGHIIILSSSHTDFDVCSTRGAAGDQTGHLQSTLRTPGGEISQHGGTRVTAE